MKGIIFDIKRYSIHDGPGLRTTVFFKSCPLQCSWCHNPESLNLYSEIVWYKNKCLGCLTCVDVCKFHAVDAIKNRISINENCTMCGDCVENCPTNALEIIGKDYEPHELLDEILKDELFFSDGGGITISGGEPFAQREFLFELLKMLKAKNIHITLDTTGYTNTNNLLESAKYVDLFLYDLKQMDERKHKIFTGVSNKLILRNLKILGDKGAAIVIRIPIIPTVNDDEENIKATINFISNLKGIKSIDLLPYHDIMIDKYKRLKMPFLMSKVKKPTDKKMRYLKDIFKKAGFAVNIGG